MELDRSIASSVDSPSTSRVRPTRRTGQLPCRYENDGNVGCSNNGASCSVDSDCSTGNTCSLSIVKTVVDDDADDAASVYAGDLDGDNTNDVLAANKAQDEIAWYQNDGTSLNFAKYVISDAAAGSSSVVMADVDLDGDIDAASGSNNKDRIQWYEDDCRTFAPTSEPTAVPTGTPLDDTTIRTAVTAWLSDATAAEATYGHISTWETGGVTGMELSLIHI